MTVPGARQGTADLAKGLAVLLMIQVHLTELFAVPPLYDGLYGRISLFLGGPPVAPVFMAVLGYFVAATRRSARSLLSRGLGLLLIALLLNVGLNAHLLLKIQSGAFPLNPWDYIFGVDILFLAALSILILAALRPQLRKSLAIQLLLAAIVALLTPVLTEVFTVDSAARYPLALLGGDYFWSYFPLFPWLAYPLLGFAYCVWQARSPAWDPAKRGAGVLLALTGAGILLTLNYAVKIAADLPAYYHHGLLFFGWTTLFLAFWMTALSLLEQRAGMALPLRYVKWLGRNVTTVYILQWLIIGNLATALYKTQTLGLLFGWYLLILATVSLAALALDTWRARRQTAAGA